MLTRPEPAPVPAPVEVSLPEIHRSVAVPNAAGWLRRLLAFGTRAHLGLLPGLAEHALPLKLVGDALHIRNRVLQRGKGAEVWGWGTAYGSRQAGQPAAAGAKS